MSVGPAGRSCTFNHFVGEGHCNVELNLEASARFKHDHWIWHICMHMYAAPRYRMRVYIVQNKPPNNYNSCKTWQKCFKQPSSMTCCKTAAALFCTLGIYPDVVLSRWTLPRFKSLNASYQSHCACRSKMTPSKTVLHALEPAVVWCVMLPHILVEHLCSSSCAQTNTL